VRRRPGPAAIGSQPVLDRGEQRDRAARGTTGTSGLAARVDGAERAVHAAPAGRPAVPVPGPGRRARRLGDPAAHGVGHHRLPRRLHRRRFSSSPGSASCSTRSPTGCTSWPRCWRWSCATASRCGGPRPSSAATRCSP
jgi:hypothetical protein